MRGLSLRRWLVDASWAALALMIAVGPAFAAEGRVFTQKSPIAPTRVRGAPATPADPAPTAKMPNNDLAGGPTAEWIWGGPAKDDDAYFFRTEFEGGSKT